MGTLLDCVTEPPGYSGTDRNKIPIPKMPKIKTDQLKEGMVVKADVKNLDDMLLIPAGCEMTPKHIKILNAWGIGEVSVENPGPSEEEPDALAKLSPEAAAKLEAELKQRFWKFDTNDPIQKEVFRLALQRRARLGVKG